MWPQLLNPDQFCTVWHTGNICTGDSGGGLVRDVGGWYEVAGIASMTVRYNGACPNKMDMQKGFVVRM